jgi:uncharacterized membrane protein YbjE (DUF340 family)
MIMSFLFLGVAAGFFLRKSQKTISLVDSITNAVIFFLLFLLGVSVSRNETVFSSFSRIGVQAAAITTGGTLGSVLLSSMVYKYFFKRK